MGVSARRYAGGESAVAFPYVFAPPYPTPPHRTQPHSTALNPTPTPLQPHSPLSTLPDPQDGSHQLVEASVTPVGGVGTQARRAPTRHAAAVTVSEERYDEDAEVGVCRCV